MILLEDVKFYFHKHGVISSCFSLGLWSLLVYRIGHFMHGKSMFKLILFWYVYLIFKNILILFSKVELPPTSTIGHRLNLVHAYGLVMGDKVIIGDDVTIGPWVVLGHNGNPILQPVISNNVYIGAKATILGGIEIGENVIIGPNVVLTKCVENGKVVKSAFCVIK
jgi:serine O-acetyltransferase